METRPFNFGQRRPYHYGKSRPYGSLKRRLVSATEAFSKIMGKPDMTVEEATVLWRGPTSLNSTKKGELTW